MGVLGSYAEMGIMLQGCGGGPTSLPFEPSRGCDRRRRILDELPGVGNRGSAATPARDSSLARRRIWRDPVETDAPVRQRFFHGI